MRKCYLELLDVLRAEIADLYRLRNEDGARLRRLERLIGQLLSAGHDPSASPPTDYTPTETH